MFAYNNIFAFNSDSTSEGMLGVDLRHLKEHLVFIVSENSSQTAGKLLIRFAFLRYKVLMQ